MDNETIVKVENVQKWKKSFLLKIILTALVCIIFLFLSFVAYGAAVQNQFYKLLVVTSGSMSPVFEAGDMIMIVKLDPEDVKANDIITFQTKSGDLLTHRVVEIKPDGEIVTKGDANDVVDSWPDGWKLKKAETIYVARIPYFGRVVSSLKGLFVADTGAWLCDTEKIEINLNAGDWEVEPILDSEILMLETESIEPKETSLTPTPEPTLTPAPEPTLTPEPDPTEPLDSRLELEPIIVS